MKRLNFNGWNFNMWKHGKIKATKVICSKLKNLIWQFKVETQKIIFKTFLNLIMTTQNLPLNLW
jgi:hypothetical protein